MEQPKHLTEGVAEVFSETAALMGDSLEEADTHNV